VVSRARPEDDPYRRRPDIAKAESLLGWKPRTALREGLQQTIAYFDRLLSDPLIRRSIAEEAA
jgi:UDP-glucuronate decarboxylase